MMRDISLRDLIELEKFGINHLPDINNDLYFVQKSIVNDSGVVLGAALAHLTSEVTLILRPDLPKLLKARALSEVFTTMAHEISSKGLEDVHVFVEPDTDEHYADILVKHFGFVRASGLPMYMYYGRRDPVLKLLRS